MVIKKLPGKEIREWVKARTNTNGTSKSRLSAMQLMMDKQWSLEDLMDENRLTSEEVWDNFSILSYTGSEPPILSLEGKVKRRQFLEKAKRNLNVWGELLQPETQLKINQFLDTDVIRSSQDAKDDKCNVDCI